MEWFVRTLQKFYLEEKNFFWLANVRKLFQCAWTNSVENITYTRRNYPAFRCVFVATTCRGFFFTELLPCKKKKRKNKQPRRERVASIIETEAGDGALEVNRVRGGGGSVVKR